MSKKCYAAIDIGSNAARLLIKREEENENLVSRKLAKVLLLRVPLRLGFDVFALGKLSDERIIKMRRLMKAYRQLMKIYEVTDYRACATSAMRDAKNGKAVINKILRETGIHIEIIDGQEEARMIYNNHVECLEDRTGNFIYVDVGGGSTEINLMVNGELVQSLSYNIGTVRILSGAVKPETWSIMQDDLRRLTAGFQGINIIGSGGNINKLYRMAADKDKKTHGGLAEGTHRGSLFLLPPLRLLLPPGDCFFIPVRRKGEKRRKEESLHGNVISSLDSFLKLLKF